MMAVSETIAYGLGNSTHNPVVKLDKNIGRNEHRRLSGIQQHFLVSFAVTQQKRAVAKRQSHQALAIAHSANHYSMSDPIRLRQTSGQLTRNWADVKSEDL